MDINPQDTAFVVTDPQNDVLSEKGAAWGLVGDKILEIGTVEHLDQLFSSAKRNGYDVVISPHYYYPSDQGWRFGGPVEQMMRETGMFARPSALSVEGFEGSGADWLEQYKQYIDDGKTIVTSPHKVFGPEANDLVLQLRKLGKTKVVLAGMLANLCVESHLRELVEQGFEVAVVKDATAAPNHPQLGDGYPGAVVNFGFVANSVITTDEAVKAMGATPARP
jgi:nicotinamidase-related amidase